MIFKTVESFRKQLDKAIDKVKLSEARVEEAKVNFGDSVASALGVADSITAEADALIVRANQINAMVDAVTEAYSLS